MLLIVAGAFALSIAPGSPATGKAYAASGKLATASSSSNVRYIAVFGADTWVTASSGPACDLTVIARVDMKNGTLGLLTIPRDMQYTGYISKKELGFTNKSAPLETFNSIFRYQFKKTINKKWNSDSPEGLHSGNYEEAIKASAEKTCQIATAVLGVSVTDYAVVDLYTFENIVDLVGGLKVDLPAPIKDYRLYSVGTLHTVNNGKLGVTTLGGYDAMIASRARDPYANLQYADASDYTGSAPQLLLPRSGGGYWLSSDGTRQFLCRRMLASLVDKALDSGTAAWSFVWNQLVNDGLMWTNLSESDVKTMGNKLAKAKKANKFVVYGAQLFDANWGGTQTINGLEQWLYPIKTDKAKQQQVKDVAAQFKAGKYMSEGWGAEAIVGLPKGEKKKQGGITYKALNSTAVSVVAIPNKRNVTIPATVTLNGKKYSVTTIAKASMKGLKVRTVTLGENVSKLAAGAFRYSKAKTIVVKTTNFTKASVKGSLENSAVRTIKVSVPSKVKKATIKKYRSYFTPANSRCGSGLKVK